MKKINIKGFTIVELLVAIGVFILLCLISFSLVRQIIERAKIASAKAEISQISALLEMVKHDTGVYPVFLSDLTQKTPPSGQQQGWQGPYINSIPLDPWDNPYVYQIPPTTLFSSPPLPRSSGPPEEDTYSFSDTYAQQATLEIENYGITSATIYLNGTEVVSPSEFKKNPDPQIINVNVNLINGQNNVFTIIASKPGENLYISISSDIPTSQYFILGSYGADGESGGTGFNADIIWQSNVYPNFLTSGQLANIIPNP
jgi:general secretion pathway protein G